MAGTNRPAPIEIGAAESSIPEDNNYTRDIYPEADRHVAYDFVRLAVKVAIVVSQFRVSEFRSEGGLGIRMMKIYRQKASFHNSGASKYCSIVRYMLSVNALRPSLRWR
jgi:hypothetical protein